MSVIVATAYMDEAQRFDWLVAMDGGQILSTGTPAELLQRTGMNSLDDEFIALNARRKTSWPSVRRFFFEARGLRSSGHRLSRCRSSAGRSF